MSPPSTTPTSSMASNTATVLTITGLSIAVTLLSIHTIRLKYRFNSLSSAHAQLLAESKDTSSQLSALKQDLESSKAQLESDSTANQALLEERSKSHQEKTRSLSTSLSQTRQELQKSKSSLDSVRSEATVLKEENNKLRRDLAVLQDRYAKQDTLLEQRTAELKGAEAFLTKADTVSGAEVVGMVEKLNGEIMQLAAMLAEEFVVEEGERQRDAAAAAAVTSGSRKDPTSPTSPTSPSSSSSSSSSSPPHESSPLKKDGEISPHSHHHHHHPHSRSYSNQIDSETYHEAFLRTEEILGSRMTALLRSSPPSAHFNDPTLVQMAFQTALTAYAHWIVSSWCFENPEDEGLLTEVYARVRETEEQAVSGRWRQLTRTHLQRMLINNNTPSDLSSDMADAFTQILIAAGTIPTSPSSASYDPSSASTSSLSSSPTPVPTATHPDPSSSESTTPLSLPQLIHAKILSTYSSRIQRITSMSQDLNRVIGEGVTSCDLEALFIGAEVRFSKETMDVDVDSLEADADVRDDHRSSAKRGDKGVGKGSTKVEVQISGAEKEKEKEPQTSKPKSKSKTKKSKAEKETETSRSVTPTPATVSTFIAGGTLTDAPLSIEGEEVDEHEHEREPGSAWDDDSDEDSEEDDDEGDDDDDQEERNGLHYRPRSIDPSSPSSPSTHPHQEHQEQEEPEDDGDIVLCTTDLGLVRAEKVPGKAGEWYESVLLKPKVVLVRMVRGLFNSSGAGVDEEEYSLGSDE